MITIFERRIFEIARKNRLSESFDCSKKNDFSKFILINDLSKTLNSRNSELFENSEFSRQWITRKFWILETVTCPKVPTSRNIRLLEKYEVS